MSAEDIRLIVERCYTSPTGILVPNALDQLNPNVDAVSSDGPTPAPLPGEVVRNIVGRCYSIPVPNDPNPLDQELIRPVPEPPEIDPPPTPGDQIRRIVERCYGPPDPPFLEPPPPDIPEWTVGWEPPPWVPFIVEITGGPPPPTGITIGHGDPGVPVMITTVTTVKDDCKLVAIYLEQKKVRNLPDYSEPGYPAPGWWEHIDTLEKYYCDLSKPMDPPFKQCVKNALECLFRPYFGGMWKPPQADCSSYWPNGWSGNQTEVCVENCFPDRTAIYESYMSNGTLQVTFDASGQIVATGTGSAVVVLRLWWNDRPWTYGTAIDSIDVGSETWTREGRSGEVTKTINITGAGTTAVSFTGLHSANSPLTIVDNNTRICMKDGDGNDCNANFGIVSTNLAADHSYYCKGMTSNCTPTGARNGNYSLTNTKPAFYALKEAIPNVTVPLFRFFSTMHTDTFLTTNPGAPDTDGVGERVSMNAAGMAGGEVIGHVFPSATAMNSYLAEGEQAEALHRFHSSNPFDHKYKIDGDFADGVPTKLPDYFAYRIPNEPKADLNIQIDVEKGDSSYDNSMGFYLADDTGPKYGRIICTSARGGTELYNAYVPSAKLEQYAGGTMGFFLLSDGNGRNTLTMNQEFTFDELNSPHPEGYRGTGINTAQSNYVFFSDRRWNPLLGDPAARKDFTKWQGKNNQFWEDLLNGDDDYNDLKFWHRLGWTYDGFMYEGIQCYVYGVEAPPKIMRKIDPATKCDTRILQASFKDMVLRRMDCGNKIPDITVGPDQDWECGECWSDNTWWNNPASLAWRITDPDGATSSVSATFDASGNLVTTGTGTATVTFSFSWSDNPGDHGTALGTYEITSLGLSFTQGAGQSGSLPNQTVTIAAGQTYNCTITNGNAAGFDRTNGNQTLCFKDSDGTDCNATLSIAGTISQQTTETEVTNSATEKGSWVQVGASNNPANGWTSHMINYGIYPSVPLDTVEDPLIDEWQTHTATINFANSGVYYIRMESDNHGTIKLTDGSGNIIVDREVNYSSGIGQETLKLSLTSGNYTMETRVKNQKKGKYVVRLNDRQTIKAAVGGSFKIVSMGGISGGIRGNCMKFTLQVEKNGDILETKQFEAQYWPRIGQDLFSGAISLSPGDPNADPPVPPDTLTIECVSIDTGPATGDIALEAALYDTSEQKFDGVFKIMLATQTHDAVIGSQMGNPTNNPIEKEGGEVEGFAMSYNPTNRQEFEWEAGSKYNDRIPNPPDYDLATPYATANRVLNALNIYEATAPIAAYGTAPTHTSGTTNSWKFIRVAPYPTWSEDDVPDPGYPYTYTWTGNNPVWMHGSLQVQPQLPGLSRTINNPLMPNIPGGYIDTGYTYEKDLYFSATLLESYNYRNISGVYNHLVEDYLFTRFETQSGNNITQEQKDILTESAPTTFARKSKPWYMLGSRADNNWYVNPATIAWRITDGSGVQIATSVEKKGPWVATGTSNNPGNGWTQHMKQYGIYKVKPADDMVDPFIDTWQTHVCTVTIPSSTTYSMRIESDNWGYLKITDSSNNILIDREITYTAGAGGETIPLTLSAGDYTIESRVKNADVGSYQGVVDAIWNGSKQAPQRDTYFSPLTFVHDYTLDNYHGTGGSNYLDACKIRVGITFYPVVFDQTTGSKQVHYWQAMVHVIDVIDKGKGYTKGAEFVLTWPPMRERSSEDISQTPFYPDYEEGFFIPAGKQLAWWENQETVRRSLKEAFYMESHNKDSVIWYSSTDKAKFRVRFKVTLTEATDVP